MKDQLEAALLEQADVRARVRRLDPLPGGACQDNYVVELEFETGPLEGERKMVLRCDAASSLPGSISRKDEFEAISAAVAAGVKTPAAWFPLKDLARSDSHAYLLEWVEGQAIGRKIVGAPELEAARARLPEDLATQLARIHSITRETMPELFPQRIGWCEPAPDGARPAESTIAGLRKTFDALPEPHPALELALIWLEENVPAQPEITLVHGDYRTGNFMVTPEGLSAVLDWEFCHWGCPEEDLAWISVRDWRFGVLDKPIGGFAERGAFYDAYEKASGRRVNRDAVHYWEVWGNVHWAAGCVYQGERYLTGQEKDLELVAIARRAAEMEFEALRLIEKGPA